VLLDHFQEAELIVHRSARVEAPVHIRQIEFQRRILGVLGDDAALFDEPGQWLHFYLLYDFKEGLAQLQGKPWRKPVFFGLRVPVVRLASTLRGA
jgi:hypothetical protein